MEGDSKETLTEKFLLLRDAYDKLKDENTLLEYENESLKDYQDEREEEVYTKQNTLKFQHYLTFLQMKLQRTDLLHLSERLKVLEKEREGDRTVISKQKEIIENYAKDAKFSED